MDRMTDNDIDDRCDSPLGGFDPESIQPTRYPSGQSQLKPKLDAIFDEIQRNLPSIDDNIEDEDLAETIEIFQHPHRRSASLSDEDEKDLDESLLPEGFSGAMNATAQNRHDFNVEDDSVLGIESLTASGSALHSNYTPGKCSAQSEYLDFPELSRMAWRNDSIQNGSARSDVRTKTSSDIRVVESQLNFRIPGQGDLSRHALSPEPMLKLSMNGLEDVDFDVLLQRAVETEYRTRSRKISVGLDDVINEASALSSEDESCQRFSPSNQPSLNNAALMEKLAALCSSHTGAPVMIDPQTGAAVHNNVENATSATTVALTPVQQQKPRDGRDRYTSTGTMKNRRLPQEDERHTVFLDLRRAESKGTNCASQAEMQQSVAQRVFGIRSRDSSDTSSSDDDNDDDEHNSYSRDAWFEHRRRVREASSREAFSSDARTSAVSSQTERKSADHAVSTNPEQHVRQSNAVHEQFKSHTAKRCQRAQQRTTRDEQKQLLMKQEVCLRADDVHLPSSGDAETPSASQHATSSACSKSAGAQRAGSSNSMGAQESSSREASAAAKTAQSRARLKSNLEALRPTTSTNGKRDCAATTPVLFDSVGSYASPISSIMATWIAAKESVLLTVYLASNGEIVEHRSPAMKTIDSGNSWPASYVVLLSWLGSLIPNVTDINASVSTGINHGAPFDVVGMQQMWFRGRLMLVIAVVPTDGYQDKYSAVARKSKKKDGDQTTHFQQIVAKFLATHSLRDACPWLQNCEPQPICSRVRRNGDACSPGSYVYYAPAPVASSKVLSTFVHMNPDPEAACKVFNARIGFFWQTVDDHREIHEDEWSCANSSKTEAKDTSLTHVTFVTVKQHVYRAPEALFAVLARSLQQGLDIAGVRLLVTQASSEPMLSVGGRGVHVKSVCDNSDPPLLAFALRGALARPVWLEELGPADPSLARRTDPNSLMALYGGEDRTAANLYTPRSEFKISEELATFFGGRVPSSGVINVGLDAKVTKTPPAEESDLVVTDELSSVAHLLTATVESDVLVVISHLVPVRCYGIVISACQRRGYSVRGMRRKRLSSKQAIGMGIAEDVVSCFASQLATSDDSGSCLQALCAGEMKQLRCGNCCTCSLSSWGSRPAAILHLRKENGAHHATSLTECFMVQLTLQGQLDRVSHAISGRKLTSGHLFHVIPYSTHVYHAYAGGDFMKVPDLDSPAVPGYIAPRLHQNDELEQVVVLALNGREQAATFGLLLAEILGTPPHQKGDIAERHSGASVGDACCLSNDGAGRLELLGMKWLPRLSIGQAKELTPCEPGDREWKSSLHRLTAGPAVILCLRGIKPHAFLRRIIEQKADDTVAKKQHNYEKIFSATAEMAYRLASMFFFDHELFPDDESRPLLPYLPKCRGSVCPASSDGHGVTRSASAAGSSGGSSGHQRDAHLLSNLPREESILKGMLLGPRPLATVLVIRPSVLRRNNLARLFRAIFHEGFWLAGLHLRSCTEAEALHILQRTRSLPDGDTATTSATAKASHGSLADRDEQADEQLQCLMSAESLVVCLLRENGIKRLLDVLGPDDPIAARRLDTFLLRGCYGTNLTDNGFYGSADYTSSVKDIKTFFPDGLCCLPTLDLDRDEIKTSVHDGCLVPHKRAVVLNANTASPHGSLGMPSADLLTEINCLLLMPGALSVDSRRGNRSQPLLVDILECLQVMSFSIVGAKLLLLSDEQARCYLHLVNAGSFQLVPELTASACLVLAVQRDNAVTTFPYLLKSGFAKSGVEYVAHDRHLMYPKDIDTAKKTLCFFFESLSTSARWKIYEKDTL